MQSVQSGRVAHIPQVDGLVGLVLGKLFQDVKVALLGRDLDGGEAVAVFLVGLGSGSSTSMSVRLRLRLPPRPLPNKACPPVFLRPEKP